MEGISETAEQLAEDLRNRRYEARDPVIMVAQRKQKKYYDASKTAKEFEVGDLVRLKFNRFASDYSSSPEGSRSQIAPPPLTPGNSITDHGEALALPSVTGWPSCLRAGRSTTSFPSPTHLRRYRGKSDDIRPLPITVDGEEEYEV
jgi:hypothetical protein